MRIRIGLAGKAWARALVPIDGAAIVAAAAVRSCLRRIVYSLSAYFEDTLGIGLPERQQSA